VGKYCGLAQYWRKTRETEERAIREEVLKDVEGYLDGVRRTRASNPLPDETALEDERANQSSKALMQRATLDCRAL